MPIVSLISVVTFVIWLIASYFELVPYELIQDDIGGPNCDTSSTSSAYFLFAFSRGLSVWVSACPCAFGLATPTAVLVATGLAARHGILFRKGAALQYLSEVSMLAFDKTGTLTNGKMSVTDSYQVEENDVSQPNVGIHGLEWGDIYMMVLKAEMRSSHPLARGLVHYCQNIPEVAKALLDEFEHPHRPRLEVLEQSLVSGKGIKASIGHSMTENTYSLLVGTYELLTSHGVNVGKKYISIADSYRYGGKVAIYVAVNDRFCVFFGLADTIRPESPNVIANLRERGMNTSMITGDEWITARTIGLAVNIPQDEIYAKASPDNKKEIVISKQSDYGKIAFVGDGTNDSPALAMANVGIVMSSGTDVAIEVGDVVLCKNDLHSLLVAIDISNVTMRRIKINYVWALGYNILLIPIAAGILYPHYHYALDPAYAGGAMALSSVSVVISSLTLLLYRPPISAQINKDAGHKNNHVFDDDDLCKCPVSISYAHSTRSSLSTKDETSLSALRRRLSNLVPSHEGETFNPLGGNSMVYHQLNSSDPAVTYDDGVALEMMETGKGTRGNSVAHIHENIDVNVDISGGCGCGKKNCMCGSGCRCGTSSKATSYSTASRKTSL